MKNVDIILMIALDEEYTAWRRTLAITPILETGRERHFSIMRKHYSENVTISLVVYVIGEMGLVPAANATNFVLARYNPSWLISLGISGQLSNDCSLGDVVIALHCDHAYSEARQSVSGVDFAGADNQIQGLESFISSIDGTKYLQGRELFLNVATRKMLTARNLWRRYPYVHSGPVCSTDFVVDTMEKKAELQAKNRRFLCTDMESAAIAISAKKIDFAGRMAVIRGISDPADGTKKKIDSVAGAGTIRQYAIQNASLVFETAILDNLKENSFGSTIARPLIAKLADRMDHIEKVLLTDEAKLDDKVFRLNVDEQFTSIDRDLAKYAFRSQSSAEASGVPRPLLRKFNESASELAVSYLVAYHVMAALKGDFSKNPELLSPLTHVHTYQINQFCKSLLENSRRTKQIYELVKSIINAYALSNKKYFDGEARYRLQAHLCYLMGRIPGEQTSDQVKQALQNWRKQLIIPDGQKAKASKTNHLMAFSAANLENLSSEQLLQFRTIQISLVQLGVKAESDSYIASCLASSRLDLQNRGFHLEYYKDIPFDGDQPLRNEDKLGPCTKTLEILGKKLSESVGSNTTYPLRDIDIFTVASLLLRRNERNKLSKTDRDLGTAILTAVENFSSSDQLAKYLSKTLADLSEKHFQPNQLLVDIYQLKKLPRSGWNAKGRKVSSPESIAAHTFGGLCLIEFFLPETDTPEGVSLGDGYNKEQVMRMFLKHDWAEAFTGDLLPEQHTPEAARNEESVSIRLGMSYVYEPFKNTTVFEDWVDFEKGGNINAVLAREIDQLDSLQQLLIEYKDSDNSIPDIQAWIDYIDLRIKTPLGKRVFEFIIGTDSPFVTGLVLP